MCVAMVAVVLDVAVVVVMTGVQNDRATKKKTSTDYRP